MSSKQERQHHQLIVALRESRDADQLWQRAMADDVRAGAPAATLASRSHLDGLWLDRECARRRLADLRWVDFGAVDGVRRRGVPAPPIHAPVIPYSPT